MIEWIKLPHGALSPRGRRSHPTDRRGWPPPAINPSSKRSGWRQHARGPPRSGGKV